MLKTTLFAFCFFAFAKALCAQTIVDPTLDYYLPNNITYDNKIPTPQSVLGYVPGKWHVTHDKLAEYMKVLDAASDRITIEDRGKTFEGRSLLLLTITAPQNHARIDQIKEEHMKLSAGGSMNTADMPLVVYQGFSIHGNEPSGANAGLVLAYYLAAAQGEAIDNLLKNTVILFDPSFNPDGLQRFAGWVNQHKNKNVNPDSSDREYGEVWPGARTNHYWFDMNRDWLPVQLPESQARIETFQSWLPNILTDHHEMGTNSSFFFQPGIPSRTHPLTPALNQQLTKEIGNYHAAALDKIGSFYYTEESFDDFYYGKGSTLPDINGGIGILFEQASSRGHAQESENGLLTFPFTIRNQFTAGLSTLEAAQKMRVKLLDYQQTFYKDALREAGKDAIIFGDEKDAARATALATVLLRHKIDVHKIEKDVTHKGKKYKKDHAYIIPKNQKKAKLIQAMFEKRTTFQDSLFYDISAWSFPLAFDLDYDESAPMSYAGDKIASTRSYPGATSYGNAILQPTSTLNVSTYAYLIPWNEYYTPRAINQLLNKGLRAKVGMENFSLAGIDYDYGTILIPVQNQNMDPDTLNKFLINLQDENGIQFNAVNTGLTTGIDLGSGQFRALEKPEIALLVGDGMDPYDGGEIWHMLDQRFDMIVTKLDINNIARRDLSKYTTIIVPPTYGSPDKSSIEALKTWTRNGGTLIAYGDALRWINSEKILELDFKTTENPAKNVSFEQRDDFNGAQQIGGAIFETKLDRSHPIAFGYKDDFLPIFRNSRLFITPSKESYKNPIKYTSNPLISGYISKINLEALKSTVPFQHGNFGRGDVVAFTDNTQFRGFWFGTNKLLLNAIFFAKEM